MIKIHIKKSKIKKESMIIKKMKKKKKKHKIKKMRNHLKKKNKMIKRLEIKFYLWAKI